MPARALLHRTCLEEFKQFLTDHQIEWRDGKGEWQLIQVRSSSGRWHPIFDRLQGDHYTVPSPLVNIVRRYIDWRHNDSI